MLLYFSFFIDFSLYRSSGEVARVADWGGSRMCFPSDALRFVFQGTCKENNVLSSVTFYIVTFRVLCLLGLD